VCLADPESVKKSLSCARDMSDGTKANYVNTYSCFLEKEGLTWNAFRYKRAQTFPFIPSETELNQLIAVNGKNSELSFKPSKKQRQTR